MKLDADLNSKMSKWQKLIYDKCEDVLSLLSDCSDSSFFHLERGTSEVSLGGVNKRNSGDTNIVTLYNGIHNCGFILMNDCSNLNSKLSKAIFELAFLLNRICFALGKDWESFVLYNGREDYMGNHLVLGLVGHTEVSPLKYAVDSSKVSLYTGDSKDLPVSAIISSTCSESDAVSKIKGKVLDYGDIVNVLETTDSFDIKNVYICEDGSDYLICKGNLSTGEEVYLKVEY